MPDHEITPLVEELCQLFNLDYKNINYIQKHEMLYIHKELATSLGTDEIERIAEEIMHMRYRLRTGGRSRSLYPLFRHLQSKSMAQGEYDFSTKQLPYRFYFTE